MFPKLAMLFFYLRIFFERWQQNACYILMGILVATAVAALIANLMTYVPAKFQWGDDSVVEEEEEEIVVEELRIVSNNNFSGR